MISSNRDLAAIYPRCRTLLEHETWQQIVSSPDLYCKPENFPLIIRSYDPGAGLPEFLSDLARLEWSIFRVKEGNIPISDDPEEMAINPTLLVLELNGRILWIMKALQHRSRNRGKNIS